MEGVDTALPFEERKKSMDKSQAGAECPLVPDSQQSRPSNCPSRAPTAPARLHSSNANNGGPKRRLTADEKVFWSAGTLDQNLPYARSLSASSTRSEACSLFSRSMPVPASPTPPGNQLANSQTAFCVDRIEPVDGATMQVAALRSRAAAIIQEATSFHMDCLALLARLSERNAWLEARNAELQTTNAFEAQAKSQQQQSQIL
ncbi:hypothetical protein K437DRAFT_113068 [Tilletiaria anomala UBC 951]|uniref:Uncharacterized protein n=1 Tax=Tilletiaria anomala (strain ATCC 24038 / CBS 436.72 / UBC 951) TaxID=1037660 RepID=A0A066VWQ2_TILAU|nr:uncharacterized protein K437DRAFT_113068 [Tilletiaria anomala UBC 951]KDN45881.1 hypothetical protein K437DRAFT_113068 [Tilletiaria anomala UBC 951]